MQKLAKGTFNIVLLSWPILCIGLLATLYASLFVKNSIEEIATKQFIASCDQATLKIRDRLNIYAMILRGGSGLFSATNSVSRDQWHAYVRTLHADRNVPGVQGIGFTQVIPQGRLAAHIARIRAEGFPDYTVRPSGERTLYTSIIYLEPFRDRNLRAFGFDMFSEPVRRNAMEQARDSGEAALSGKVELVQEDGKEVQAGTLMYFPVYRNDASLATLEQRREALIGWVYSPFRMNDLMTGTISELSGSDSRVIDVHIYDGPSLSPAKLLFDSNPSKPQQSNSASHIHRVIQFDPDTQWVLRFEPVAGESNLDYTYAWVSLIAGLVISGLMFGLMRSLINTRTNATRIAEGLTDKIGELSQRLSIATDSAKIGVWDYQVKENKLLWDNSMYPLYGVSPDNFSGAYQAWQQGLHPDDRERGDRELKQALNGEHPFDTEFRVVWPTGEVRHLKASATVLCNDEGEAVRMIGVNYDITERKEYEIALKERTEQLSGIFSLSPDGFVSFDGSRRVKYVSPAFSSMTGLKEDEITGIDESEFTAKLASLCVPSQTFSGLDGLVAEDAKEVSEESRRELIELLVPVGRILQVGLRTSNTSSVSQMLYFRDVTHETEVDRLKTEFLSHAAHELRTPMTSIMGFSELLLERELDAPTQRDILETINRRSIQLVDIINELLDIARIEARRKQDLTIIEVDLASLAHDTVVDMGVLNERCRIVLDLPPGAIYAFADIDKLRRALTNIIGNAMKYSPDDGEIRIAVITAPGKAGITVSDQGIGMTPEQILHFGDRFWRADTSGKIPGTGLGVAIVKETLALLGGNMDVSSIPDQGTRLTLWLPTRRA
jgi:PAS domain S-box-containing protein